MTQNLSSSFESEVKDIAETKDLSCLSGSIKLLEKLATEYSGHFKHILLIHTKSIQDNSWLKSNGNDMYTHTYMLAQDNNGSWYSCSPANNGGNNEAEYGYKIIYGNNLGAVITKINDRDKIVMPTEDDILEAVDLWDISMPTITNQTIEYINIVRNVDGTEIYQTKKRIK